MTSFKPFGEDFGTWHELDEVGELAVSVMGQGTTYLKEHEVEALRDHLTAVLRGAGLPCDGACIRRNPYEPCEPCETAHDEWHAMVAAEDAEAEWLGS